jgi:hypothetical protein
MTASPSADPPSAYDPFAGGGTMAAQMRRHDWSATPLGRPESWPQSLKTAVGIMLSSRYAMWMAWGDELTFFCNDAYLPTLGVKGEEAGSAVEALAKVRGASGRFDAAILDMGLPDRPGDQLAAELRAIRRDLPLLIASGYDSRDLQQRFAGDRRIAVMAKAL